MTQRQLIKGVFSPPTTTTIGPNLTQLSLRSQKCLGGCPGRSPADNPTCHQFTHHLSVHRWTIWLTVFHSTMTHVFQFIYQCLGFVWTVWENPTPHDWEHHCVPKPVSGGGSYRSWESPIYIYNYIYISGWWFQPLWKIWLRQLILYHYFQSMESQNPAMFQSTNQYMYVEY